MLQISRGHDTLQPLGNMIIVASLKFRSVNSTDASLKEKPSASLPSLLVGWKYTISFQIW
jgi:hypothetical protein